MDLEKLRYKILQGTTPPNIFYQIKDIFHSLESIGSSRIEGNNTTVMDYVENTKVGKGSETVEEKIQEIINIENATKYIEEVINEREISNQFIRELHEIVVSGLSADKEGSIEPGVYRNRNVRISGARHLPPDYNQVLPLMEELVNFVNEDSSPKYDLLKICIAHHRFVWIHPFTNGNGRVVRLFTYAMMLKKIFTSNQRIINPTAVFCSDRNKYYSYLSKADEGTDEGLIKWSEYVMQGLKTEIEKIDLLSDYSYLKTNILKPAMSDALKNKYITDTEYDILMLMISSEMVGLQADKVKSILPDKSSSDISRLLKRLIEKKMIKPTHERGRKYEISFSNNYLLRSILAMLDKNGFLPQ